MEKSSSSIDEEDKKKMVQDKLVTKEDARVYLEPFLDKKYTLSFCDGNIDAVLRTLGVGALQRAMFRSAKQGMVLTEKNGVYTLTTTYAFRKTITQFRVGEEFDEETPDKRKVKTTFFQDKTKLIQIQRGAKTTIIEREFYPDKALVTAQVDKIVSKRIYKLFSRGW